MIAGWPIAEFDANEKDREGPHLSHDRSSPPELAERLRAARREERFAGATVANDIRKPCAGWALVGEAGYNRDFITAPRHHRRIPRPERCATHWTRRCATRPRSRAGSERARESA